MTIELLEKLLVELSKNRNEDFQGLGIIIYKNMRHLPVTPLVLSGSLSYLPISGFENIVEILNKISRLESPFHDGFHMISTDMILTHVSQYFSTPIVKEAVVKYQYGSRYRTALYGSFLKDLYACCILSNQYGPIICKDGKSFDIAIPA
jgi:DNA integrity scanning protein DisA with diadenylate cyclase activity